MRDELLDRQIFYCIEEIRVITENWRVHYDTVRPHGALGYRPPAPEAIVPPVWLLNPPRPTQARVYRLPALTNHPSGPGQLCRRTHHILTVERALIDLATRTNQIGIEVDSTPVHVHSRS